MRQYVYKILRSKEWEEFSSQGEFVGSSNDLEDGFIHLSTKEQVAGVLARHFEGENFLKIVEFNTKSFGVNLVWEPSSKGDIYPHLYKSPLKKEWIVKVQDWTDS